MGWLTVNKLTHAQLTGKAGTILQATLFSLFFALILLEATGYVAVAIVSTSSMEPVLPRGSLAVFVRTGEYTLNDVIAFKVYGCLVAHRITAETPRGFKTKGDYNGLFDPWVVPEDAVVGELAFSIPLLGYVFAFFRAPLVFATVSTAVFIYLTRHRF